MGQEGRWPGWGTTPHMLNLLLAKMGVLPGSTLWSSLTVEPKAFGYCSVTKIGRFSAVAPRTCKTD